MTQPTYAGYSADEIKAVAQAATPGKWCWRVDVRHKNIYLHAQHSGQLTVMDFTRWGMQSAQPRFRVPPLDLMTELSECAPHPDARHIATADPTVVLALLDHIARLESDNARLRGAQSQTYDLAHRLMCRLNDAGLYGLPDDMRGGKNQQAFDAAHVVALEQEPRDAE